MVGNRADAEELTQEVFLKAHRALPNYRSGASMSTWLYRIMINTVNDHIRKAEKESRLRKLFGGGNVTGYSPVSSSYQEPESAYLTKEMENNVRKALNRLPSKYRMVIVLKEVEEKSYREISEILGISIGTVESRLYRARETLRRELASASMSTEEKI